MVEINFLCVHKRYREKRVAPVLIREITRRVNRRGLFQAVYTGGNLLPRPVATCCYFHRSLNPKKLIECHFSQLSHTMTMKRLLKLNRLPDEPTNPAFRQLTEADLPAAFELVTAYQAKFKLSTVFTSVEEFRHWFLPKPNIVNSFVIQNEEGRITEFCSYYSLPSSVINNDKGHKTLFAAYSFYNAVSDETVWKDLFQNALISAKNEGYDVFNALDLMHNKEIMNELKFGQGDGHLHYYLYNWEVSFMQPHEIAVVLQ